MNSFVIKRLLLFVLLFSVHICFAQSKWPSVKLLTQETKSSLRGLNVVNDMVVWASGSNGTVGHSSDGGKTWKWSVIKGFENRDFRDIEAFDAVTAIVMAVDAPAYILKTVDGGENWKIVYENKTPGIFLDAMEFWNELSGIVIGDPIDGKIVVARTFDGGATWRDIPERYRPKALAGEAFFAASGTNVRALDRDESVLVSGGVHSRIFIRDHAATLPLVQGKETTGANSVAVYDTKTRNGGTIMTVVGGDFTNPASTSKNCFFTNNKGKTWKAPKQPPHGYRSCVEYISKKQLITCGLTGVDYTFDGGNTWKAISQEGYHTCRMAKKGAAVYLSGSNGRIAKLIFE